MKRQFALPIVIAALLHAGLLLGLRGHTMDKTTTVTKRPSPSKSDPMTIVVPPPEETESDATAPAKGAAEIAPASLPERPVVPRPADFIVAVPKHAESQRRDVMVIPQGSIGPGGELAGLGKIDGSLLRIGDLDGVPRARHQRPPVYPAEARRSGMTGEVLVEFMVDESGAVRDPRIIRSSDRVFEESAVRAVSRWRFEPGRRNGAIVRFKMAVPIVFTLAES